MLITPDFAVPTGMVVNLPVSVTMSPRRQTVIGSVIVKVPFARTLRVLAAEVLEACVEDRVVLRGDLVRPDREVGRELDGSGAARQGA